LEPRTPRRSADLAAARRALRYLPGGLLAAATAGLLALSLGAGDPPGVVRAGGKLTVDDNTSKAFGQHAPGLPVRELRKFTVGNRLFNTNWVTAPASVRSLDGLGPFFNRVSCSACHVRDGRGRPPVGPAVPMMSMLVRLSVPGLDGKPVPHPIYGDQLSDRAVEGLQPEGRAAVTWEDAEPFVYPDGTAVSLRRPRIDLVDLTHGPLGPDTMMSARVANAVFGLGLLEAVPEADIVARADPDDADGDGISGRVNRVWDHDAQAWALGRFGWKANQPTLRQQAASAMAGDVGITSEHFAGGNFTAAQTDAAALPDGRDAEGVELSSKQLDRLTFYLQTLAVPAQRDADDPAVRRGAQGFVAAGCNACHAAVMRTGPSAAHDVLAGQTFAPYTDLLLHDMGPGLADGRPDGRASGREWRTPPLWGLGLQERVSGHTFLLHDGRARNAEEAVLWHGGEAAAARDRFAGLTAGERADVLAFLGSL